MARQGDQQRQQKRNLRAFTYVEFASNWNMNDDQNNLQYTQYIVKTSFVNNSFIDHGNNLFMPEEPDNFLNKDQARHSFIGVVGQPVTGYDSDRDKFIGSYHTYANPASVVNGQCGNTVTEGDNGCGTLQMDLDLNPERPRNLPLCWVSARQLSRAKGGRYGQHQCQGSS